MKCVGWMDGWGDRSLGVMGSRAMVLREEGALDVGWLGVCVLLVDWIGLDWIAVL